MKNEASGVQKVVDVEYQFDFIQNISSELTFDPIIICHHIIYCVKFHHLCLDGRFMAINVFIE